MSSDDENFFDAIIIGTGLAESIVAAALSKAKYKVAHIDPNPYYGGDEASLSQDELLKWGERVSKGDHPTFSSYSGSTQVLPYSRQYSICLKPAIIASVGPFIASLVASGVSKYSGFKLLDSLSIYSSDGSIKNVPGSKEAVFNSKDISLIEKRRLMRFLTFAGSDFEDKPEIQGKQDLPLREFLKSTFQLSDDTVSVILYSLAHCATTEDSTLSSLLRLRSYLRSVGRYGPSPFLIGHYGGIGDISQGFCRAAAVNGGVYILGRQLLSTKYQLESSSEGQKQEAYIEVELDDFPEVLKSRLLISSNRNILVDGSLPAFSVATPSSIPQSSISRIARCIAILDRPLNFRLEVAVSSEDGDGGRFASTSNVDNAVLIFPPASLSAGSGTSAATVFVNGEGSLSTPKGRWIVYIVLPLSSSASEETAENLLRPYLDVITQLARGSEDAPVEPLSTSFFFENDQSEENNDTYSGEDPPRYIVMPPLPPSAFPDLPDNATRCAEVVFEQAIRSLRAIKGEPVEPEEGINFWPPVELEEESDDDS